MENLAWPVISLGSGAFPCSMSPMISLKEAVQSNYLQSFQIEGNLKEAEVKPVLLPSSPTSLPIRSLNDVGDCALLCGGRTLCRACADKSENEIGT